MVIVVVPLAQQLAGADAAVLRLAAVVVPGPGSEVDGVGSVVHGHVEVVVAVVLVGGGALSAVWTRMLVGWLEEGRGSRRGGDRGGLTSRRC